MCAWLCFYFLLLFYVLFVARAFSYFLFARACIIVIYIQLTLDAYFILTVIILFSLPILTFVQQLSSHSGWLLLKWSTIGTGFDGAETSCRIAHVLGQYPADDQLLICLLFQPDIIVVCTVSICSAVSSRVRRA